MPLSAARLKWELEGRWGNRRDPENSLGAVNAIPPGASRGPNLSQTLIFGPSPRDPLLEACQCTAG